MQNYICGSCQKRYSSYTAFYNHCKRDHQGSIPLGTKKNGQIFSGPSKFRGRPKIALQHKNRQQFYRCLKLQNQLIEELGNQKIDNHTILEFIQDPTANLLALKFTPSLKTTFDSYLDVSDGKQFPDDYDPAHPPPDLHDFTNLPSVVNFFKPRSRSEQMCCLVFWLARQVGREVLQNLIKEYQQSILKGIKETRVIQLGLQLVSELCQLS